MYYLYARDVSQGIYWRHQVFSLYERPWQCISQFESLSQLLHGGAMLHLIWIVTSSEDAVQMKELEDLLMANSCQLLVIYPKETSTALEDLPLRLRNHASIYNELKEGRSLLQNKLIAPVTKMDFVTIIPEADFEATTPLNESSGEANVAAQDASKRFNWFTQRLERTENKRLKKNSRVLKARLAVMGEDYGAYELAGTAALLGSKTAVIDLNRFEPSMDLRLGISPHIQYQYLEVEKEASTGLYVLMDCAKLQPLDWETVEKCSQRLSGYSNLYCFTGLYQLSDFEYFSVGDLDRVLEGMGRYFDLVVLRINAFPYDGFTMKALHWADYIIHVSPWEIKSLRAYKQLISVLREKQQIREDKHGMILVETEKGESVGLNQWISGVNILGKVPWSKQRNQNTRYGKAYFRQLGAELSPFYERIIAQLEVACGTR